MSKIVHLIRACELCEEMVCFSKSCPPSIPTSKSKQRIMIIGFNPSHYDTVAGIPFASNKDNALHDALRNAGVSFDEVYSTYAIKGWQETKKPGKKILKRCAERFLYREIAAYKPTKIVLLGSQVTELFVKTKFNELLNKVLLGPHFHAFVAYDPGYFHHIGLESSQCKTFIRELTKFFSPKYRVSDVTPLPAKNNLFDCEYEITNISSTDTPDDDIGYLEYRSGKEALKLFRDNFLTESRKPVGLDNETINLQADLADPLDFIITVGVSDGEKSLSIAMADLTLEQQKLFLRMVNQLFMLRPVVGHNFKFDLKPFLEPLLRSKRFMDTRIYDTWLIAFLVHEGEMIYGLKQLLFRELGIPDYGIDTSRITEYPLAEVRLYNAKDAYYTVKLLNYLWPKLTKKQQWLCQNVISQNIISFCYMEKCGIHYSKSVLKKFYHFVQGELERTKEILCDVVGDDDFKPTRHQCSDIITTNRWKIGNIRPCKDGKLPNNAEAIAKIRLLNKKNPACQRFCNAYSEYVKRKK
jgi:uracil-DNA glycosylase family 4